MPGWEKIQIYQDGDTYFGDILQAISTAQQEILIETYIFDIDRMTEKILAALVQARERGVEVYLMVDGVGAYLESFYLGRFCTRAGIHFMVYHALPTPVSSPFQFLSRLLFNFNFAVQSLNKRNHRKTVLIDRQTCFLGSFNFTSLHCREYSGEKAWRDSGVQLRGEPALDVRDLFFFTFIRASLPQKILLRDRQRLSRLNHTIAFSINATRKMRRRSQRSLLRRLKQAQSHVRITSAYFLPNHKLLKALIAARKRGVEVHVIHPSISDTRIVKLAALQAIHELLKNKVRIYEYQNQVLHAKIMTVDNITFLGSANFNNRSWFHDLEIEAILSDPQSQENLEIQWQRDLQNSRELQLTDFKSLPFFTRLASRIAYWFNYYL